VARSNYSQETADRTSPDLGRQIFNEIEDYSKHENFRKKVKEIFDDCIDSVPYMNKVKGYANEKIDEKIFKNGFTILIWFISLIIAAFVGGYFSKFFHQ
jgi:hypothetical protein